MVSTIVNPSGHPIPLGSLPEGPLIDPAIQEDYADEPGIRLWLIKADQHDFRCQRSQDGCKVGEWYRVVNHQIVVDTDAEASWLIRTAEAVYHEPAFFLDDLPRPVPCLACHAKGKIFTTRCLPMYQAHMFLEHT